MQRFRSTVSLFTREWIEIANGKGEVLAAVVSLFTREWIEICPDHGQKLAEGGVSLFTREWIEINQTNLYYSDPPSPSLRGSGLKWDSSINNEENYRVSLFTREWIEILNGL